MNEINELKDISLLDIVEYIKNSIDVIVSLKVEETIDEYNSKKNENAASDYETLLQKEESAIRQHISYEHQIKLEYEKLLEKLEVMDLENKLLQYQIVSKIILLQYIYIQEKDKKLYDEKLKKLQNELNNYKKEKDSMIQKGSMYKNQLNAKQKEIVKLQTKIRVLNTNSTINHRNDSNSINNSNLSILIKKKSKFNFLYC